MLTHAAPHQAQAGKKQEPKHDIGKVLVAERAIEPRAQPRAEDGRRERERRQPEHLPIDPAARRLQTRAATSTVQLKIWKTPRRSCLPQPLMLAQRIGSGPDRPASPPMMPPANPIAPSASLPPSENAIGPLK